MDMQHQGTDILTKVFAGVVAYEEDKLPNFICYMLNKQHHHH